MAKKCPACNADNKDGALVCEYCGTRLSSDKPKSAATSEETRFCSSCGKPLAADAAFCPFCGAKRNDVASAPIQDPAARQVPIPPRTPVSQGLPDYMQPGYQQQVRAARQAQEAAKPKKGNRGLSIFLALALTVEFCVAGFKYPGFLRDKSGTTVPTAATVTEEEDYLTMELTESDFIVREDPQDSASAYAGGVSSVVFDTAGALSAEDRTVGPDAPEAAFSNSVSVSFGEFCLYDESRTLTVASLGQKSDGDYDAVGYDIRLDGGEAEFDGFVAVTLPYDASWGEDVFIQYFNEKTGAWEILYAEPDGNGHVTFFTDHFCEFAVFRDAVENGYGDSSKDVLEFSNYGGDEKLKLVSVNWGALAAKIHEGKLKNETALTRLTSKGDPYSKENILKSCGNVTGHLDFLAKITKVPGLSKKVLGPLGQIIDVGSFLYQGHVYGWDKAFQDNTTNIAMFAVGAASALPPPVGPICAAISGGYYVYNTTDSVIRYIKFDGFSDEAETIYRQFTRNQIQYDRKKGKVLYAPGSTKYDFLPCGETDQQHKMWKLVFEDAEALEKNGVMSANAYVQRIMDQYVNLFWKISKQEQQSFLGTTELPDENKRGKYTASMKNDLCAWIKPYLKAQMEKQYVNMLNAMWSYYTNLEEELNTLYAVELVDPKHDYFTGSPYFNHPIGLGTDENAKPSFVNEWDNVAKTCRIAFTVARWADEGCPEYLRILGKKGDTWNYDYTYYNQKLAFIPNQAVVVTLPDPNEKKDEKATVYPMVLAVNSPIEYKEPTENAKNGDWLTYTEYGADNTVTVTGDKVSISLNEIDYVWKNSSFGEDGESMVFTFKRDAVTLNGTLTEESEDDGVIIKKYTLKDPPPIKGSYKEEKAWDPDRKYYINKGMKMEEYTASEYAEFFSYSLTKEYTQTQSSGGTVTLQFDQSGTKLKRAVIYLNGSGEFKWWHNDRYAKVMAEVMETSGTTQQDISFLIILRAPK
jgi:hypothetical protein